jgi:hypothetical protein
VSAFASPTLDVLVNAAASFSAKIQQQLEMLQSNPSPAELVEKTIDYAEAKAAYFMALRAGGASISIFDPSPRTLGSGSGLVVAVMVAVTAGLRSRRRSRGCTGTSADGKL